MRRRQLLTATAIGVAGIAGCSGGSGGDGTSSSGTATADPTGSPANTVRTLYETLYGEDDIEGANELYHPDSDQTSEPEDFEQYGGLGSMSAEVRSTEVVSRSESEAEVHATVYYTTAAGAAENVDWFTLAPHEDGWLIMTWTPEALRE